MRGDRRRHAVVALVHVRHEQHRLGRQSMERAGRVRRALGHGHRARRAPGLQRRYDLAQPGLLGDRRLLPAAGGLLHALQAALGLLEVGVEQLGLDRGDVGHGVDAALGMDHALVAVDAHHVHDGVGLADVGEEPVAQPLAAVRAGHQPGDVVEVDGVVHHLARADHRGDPFQPVVRHRHHGHVGLDRREGVVGRLGARTGQRVEQRRLARVGQPDDPDLHEEGAAVSCRSRRGARRSRRSRRRSGPG